MPHHTNALAPTLYRSGGMLLWGATPPFTLHPSAYPRISQTRNQTPNHQPCLAIVALPGHPCSQPTCQRTRGPICQPLVSIHLPFHPT
eukprot:8492097-Alexandrium_andersonii.AAC.1